MTWVYLAGAPIAIMIALYCLNNIYAKNTNAISQAKQEAPVNPLPANLQHVEPKPVQTQQVVQQPRVNPDAPQPSQMWRVVGYIKRGKGYDYRGRLPEGIRSDSGSFPWRNTLRSCVNLYAYSDQSNYYCDIEGERITPWTGKLGISKNLPSRRSGRAIGEQRAERPAHRCTACIAIGKLSNNPLPPQTGSEHALDRE
ncbi:hypothetical protein [Pseudomonas luteola]|nr:hypothetical protein [Pseudomonas luteola]